MKLNIVASLLATGLVATGATAQNFSVDWFTIDSGGGMSTGGAYTVIGTIGQPDAGTMSGGSYSLSGGFWNGISLVQTPDAPTLAIQKVVGGTRVFWPLPATGWLLDESLTLTGGWSQVAFPYTTNATAISIIVPALTGNHFYRLRKP